RYLDARMNLGLVLSQKNDLAGAASVFREILKHHPDSAEARNNLGLVLLQGKDAAGAQVSLREALRLKPDYAEAHYNLGLALLQAGQRGAAIEHLARARQLDPQSDEIRRRLAAAYIEWRDPDRALAVLKSAAGAEEHYLSASALLLSRRLPEALSESRQALKQEPQEPRYLLQQARILLRLGQHPEALEILRQVNRIQPQWAEPYYSAGVGYYLLRRYGDARRSLERALELDPRSERALFLYGATLANE